MVSMLARSSQFSRCVGMDIYIYKSVFYRMCEFVYVWKYACI